MALEPEVPAARPTTSGRGDRTSPRLPVRLRLLSGSSAARLRDGVRDHRIVQSAVSRLLCRGRSPGACHARRCTGDGSRVAARRGRPRRCRDAVRGRADAPPAVPADRRRAAVAPDRVSDRELQRHPAGPRTRLRRRDRRTRHARLPPVRRVPAGDVTRSPWSRGPRRREARAPSTTSPQQGPGSCSSERC